MFKLLARFGVRRFGARYEYDTGYLEALLDASPAAFVKFTRVAALSRHRRRVPVEAAFAAKLVGALAEDCGPCVQLVADMAHEAGVADNEIRAILASDTAAMSDTVRAAYDFADALVRRGSSLDRRRDAVRLLWGATGIVDLTLAAQASRLFPMVKAGLGFAKACAGVTVGGAPAEIRRQA